MTGSTVSRLRKVNCRWAVCARPNAMQQMQCSRVAKAAAANSRMGDHPLKRQLLDADVSTGSKFSTLRNSLVKLLSSEVLGPLCGARAA